MYQSTSGQPIYRLVLSLLVLLGALGSQVARAETPFRDLVATSGELADTTADFGKGKWTLVMLWSTDCTVCTAQQPMISAFHEKHKDTDAQVIGIALDGPKAVDSVNAYIERNGMPYTNYIGHIEMVAFNYQMLTQEPLRGTPTYLLFDPQGELKGNNPGPVRAEAIEEFMARYTP